MGRALAFAMSAAPSIQRTPGATNDRKPYEP